jgi:phosphoglycolate phosphatase
MLIDHKEGTRAMDKHLLFDFDGTLVDSLDIGTKAFNVVAERHGYARLEANSRELMLKKPVRERFRHYGVPMVHLPALAIEFYLQYKKLLKELKFFEGIPEMLHTLHEAGCQLSVMSSNDPDIIQTYMHEHGINLFRRMIGSSRLFGKDKMIRRYMRAERIRRDQVLYVGDELRDIEACKKVGVPVIWVSYGFDHEELVAPAHPDFVAHSPTEVAEIVLSQ